MRHLCESGLRENCTSRLSGGRRPAPTGASSDPTATKLANKGASAPAEPVEPRTGPEGNLESQSTCRTQDRESVSHAADRIRQFVQREPGVRLTTLLHHVRVDALRWAFFELKKDAAAGADGVTWRMYEEGLEGRLADLHDRVHSGAYRATPSRRVNIPKPDGGTRPLGVAAIEDKIVQKAVAEHLLERNSSVGTRCVNRGHLTTLHSHLTIPACALPTAAIRHRSCIVKFCVGEEGTRASMRCSDPFRFNPREEQR